MGLIICPQHGSGFMYVCPHVSEAVVAREPCRGILRHTYTGADLAFAGIELACWFCPRCVQDHPLPPNGTVIADDNDFMNGKGALYRPMCPGCFNDWRAQGLG